MRAMCVLGVALLAICGAIARPSAAANLALVLLTDVSSSIDEGEYAMVKDGYRAAFADPQVIAAILGNGGGVAVTYVEFSDASNVRVVQGWQLLTDAASARAFGEAVAAAPRSSTGNTALAASLKQATALLQAADFGDARKVIDVASDHPWDGGRSATVRDRAVEAGITINALPIIEKFQYKSFDGQTNTAAIEWRTSDMAAFYHQYVIGGPGSFLIEAHDFAAFGEALKRKLLRELIAQGDLQEAAAPAAIQ
ncbi:MAG TPA: DUF1194 domain-containing protein [Dongiaceae bacterium]